MGNSRGPIVAAIALAAVLWPLARYPQSDGFPLSNYPMFTQQRPAVTSIQTAYGVDRDGNETILDPQKIAGTSEIIQAAAVVERSTVEGTADLLCGEIAARLREDAAPDASNNVVEVIVVTEIHDVVVSLTEQRTPIDRTEHARCVVNP